VRSVAQEVAAKKGREAAQASGTLRGSDQSDTSIAPKTVGLADADRLGAGR